MDLSFRCTNVGILAGVFLVLLSVVCLLGPAVYAAWWLRQEGLL